MYLKDRTRAMINANAIAELGWVGAILSAAAGTLTVLVADSLVQGSDWSLGAWLAGWIVSGAVGGRLLRLRPLTIALCLAAGSQIVYLVFFADHGDGDGLWVVGVFLIPVGALAGYGAATSVAILRQAVRNSRTRDRSV